MVSQSKVKVRDSENAVTMATEETDSTNDLGLVGQSDLDITVAHKPPTGERKNNHSSEVEHNHKKCQLKKVSVSPRVEVMMNNELFKKYLKKNGDIIEKMYRKQGQTTLSGMKKALSNLDLSKIDFDEDVKADDNDDMISKSTLREHFPVKDAENHSPRGRMKEHNPAEIRCQRSKQRSMSLIGRDDPNIKDLEEVLQRHKTNFMDKKNIPSNHKRERRKENGTRTRFSVPSFAEFKRMRREKLVKGQEFVKSVINNKENLPLLHRDLENEGSPENGDDMLEKEINNQHDAQRQSCPDISLFKEKENSYAHNVKMALKSVSDRMECSRKKANTIKTKVKLQRESTDDRIELSAEEIRAKSVSPRESATNKHVRTRDVSDDSFKYETTSQTGNGTSNPKVPVGMSSETHSHPKHQENVKDKNRLKCFHRSKSFNELSPKYIADSSAPKISKHARRFHHSLSLTQLDGSSDSRTAEAAPDPLELSTDGTTIYALFKIKDSPREAPPSSPTTPEEESDSDENKTTACEAGNEFESGRQVHLSSGSDKSEDNRVGLTDSESSDSTKNQSSDNSEVKSRGRFTSVSSEDGTVKSSAIVRLSDMKKSCEESAKLAGLSFKNESLNKEADNKSHRTVLRASRKRKLPTRPPMKKQDQGAAPKISMETSASNNIDRNNRKQPKPILTKSQSEGNCVGYFSPETSSPGYFSFPNSPATNGVSGSVFVFPSPTGSLNSSENDLNAHTGTDAVTANSIETAESKGLVTRSISDASDSTAEAQRRRRHRKQRPYKSDPFTGTVKLPAGKLGKCRPTIPGKDEFSEEYPDDVSLQEVDEDEEFQREQRAIADFSRNVKYRLSNISDVSTDSGVIGQESIPDAPPSPSSSVLSQGSLFSSLHSTGQDSAVEVSEGHNCTDSDEKGYLDLDMNTEKAVYERKETILEIRDTEFNYGRDLKILKEEFYKPMKNNGLLSSDQLEAIFLNLEELIHVNTQFTDRLETAVDLAQTHNDENLTSVVLGDLFLKSTKLILTFEHYCVNQSQATILLEQLEREKELLRIFLKVCQDEHPVLRRMHLKSFLMVPVQRIMKYPLLLERLHKATPIGHQDREPLLLAKNKIESILEHINSRTKSATQVKLSKRKSNDRKSITVTEKIEVTRAAMDVLGWHKQEVCDILASQVHVALTQSDQNWATKKLRNVKFTPVHAILLTLGQGELQRNDEDELLFPQKSEVIQAAVVLIKEKNGKFQKLREPFLLNRCIVNVDNEEGDMFELMELNKESYLFKCEDPHWHRLWLQNVKQQTLNLGTWRKRRNALPNIMIKHLIT